MTMPWYYAVFRIEDTLLSVIELKTPEDIVITIHFQETTGDSSDFLSIKVWKSWVFKTTARKTPSSEASAWPTSTGISGAFTVGRG
jgi:hypothetical protein